MNTGTSNIYEGYSINRLAAIVFNQKKIISGLIDDSKQFNDFIYNELEPIYLHLRDLFDDVGKRDENTGNILEFLGQLETQDFIVKQDKKNDILNFKLEVVLDLLK